MKQLNQHGRMDPLLIPLILISLLLVGAAGFGAWAFMSRQDYKNNSDAKSAAAVVVAEEKTSAKKDNEFVEKEKSPLKTYAGPAAFASLSLQYPKTWSAYVGEKPSSNNPVDAYFHPGFVPVIDPTASYALRVQVANANYATTLRGFDSQIKAGKTRVTAYNPAKVPGVTGVRLDGDVGGGKQGAMVLIPVRDKTLKIWTESVDFVNDFNTNILPNFTFSQ